MRTKEVVELLDLVLFRDISKLLQEAFQVAGKKRKEESGIVSVEEEKNRTGPT